jgi:hypothetical protein
MANEGGPSRRDVLRQALALGATAGGAALGLYEVNKLLTPKPHERPYRERYNLSEIEGLPNGGLAEWYLDYHGKRIPHELEISFPDNLEHMYAEKVANLPDTVSDADAKHIAQFGNEAIQTYANLWQEGPDALGIPKIPEGLTEYPYFTHLVNSFSDIERDVLEQVDWESLAHAYGLHDAWYVDMLRHLASRAQGRSLVAYSMTEIMPYGSSGAADNIPLYDFMIRHAGMAFVMQIPSMFDPQISFGPFQFTRFAIDSGIAAPHDGLAVNQYLPEEVRVPSHLEEFANLSPDEAIRVHVTAAVLFGLQNIAMAMRALVHEHAGKEVLDAIADMDGATFAAMLAMHHHRPSEARRALLAWAHGVANGETGKPYHAYADKEVASYGEHSHTNFNAVERYFEHGT